MENGARRSYLDLLGLAWGFGWRVAAGLLIGSYADAHLGTEPALTLVCVLASFVLSVWQLLRALARQM